MSKSGEPCCDSCARGGECEQTPLCRMLPTEPPVWSPVFRLGPGGGKDAPAGEVTRALYKPRHRDGYRARLQSFGFRAPSPAGVVGLFVPTFLQVAIVPRDTSIDPTAPNFAGLAVNGQNLVNAIVPGFFTFNEGGGKGLWLPLDDNALDWWVYVQIGHDLLLPLAESGFNLSFAYVRTKGEFG